MSSLWTPEGEHRVRRPSSEAPSESISHAGAGETGPTDPTGDEPGAREELADLERQLLGTPVNDVVANHCYGLFQLAALHLGQRPPRLDDARLAIDAFAALVDALGERLGPATGTLRDGLAQIRLAFVQIAAGEQHDGDVAAQA
ncbi:MAG: hypothetical protein M0Z33_03195 [Actinomycetota bacterium]|nr:hypothetical protein [Actinomycetota bacterium]